MGGVEGGGGAGVGANLIVSDTLPTQKNCTIYYKPPFFIGIKRRRGGGHLRARAHTHACAEKGGQHRETCREAAAASKQGKCVKKCKLVHKLKPL